MVKRYKFLKPMLLLLLAGVFANTRAQYTVMLAPAGGNTYGLNELSQATIINAGAPMGMCYALIDCDEDGTGKVFTLRTTNFELQSGSNNLSYQSVVNAQVLASSAGYYAFSQTGKLPAGKYNLCITLYQAGNAGALASQCAYLNVSADGRLILTMPYDAEVLHTFNPNFSWSFTDLPVDFQTTYTIKICELKEGQSYADAIQFNPPLVYEENLQQSFYSYPMGATPLNENSKYVWQVQATINKVPKYLSEIWMFQFKKDRARSAPKTKQVPIQYPYLEKTLNSTPYVFKDIISFRYKNECPDTLLSYLLYKAGGTTHIRLTDKPVKVRFGENYYSFPAAKQMAATAKGNNNTANDVYLLEVSNSRKEKWRMKFIISNQKK